MYIENLTFKKSLEFLTLLEKNKLSCTEIVFSFYDKNKHQFITFENTKAVRSYYTENFRIFEACATGDFGVIEKFRAASNLYNFKTDFRVYDILGKCTVLPGKDFDKNRDAIRDSFKLKQKAKIEDALSDYKEYILKLRKIYIDGIYSPCYAEPGWSQGTSIWPRIFDDPLVVGQTIEAQDGELVLVDPNVPQNQNETIIELQSCSFPMDLGPDISDSTLSAYYVTSIDVPVLGGERLQSSIPILGNGTDIVVLSGQLALGNVADAINEAGITGLTGAPDTGKRFKVISLDGMSWTLTISVYDATRLEIGVFDLLEYWVYGSDQSVTVYDADGLDITSNYDGSEYFELEDFTVTCETIEAL